MKNKTYLFRYSVKDVGCDQRVREVVVAAKSLPYAMDKLTSVLSGFYRDFVIIS